MSLCAAPFPVPALPQDVERNNPALAAEFGSVMKNLKGLTTQIALLDRIHSIKVQPCLVQAATAQHREWDIMGRKPKACQRL